MERRKLEIDFAIVIIIITLPFLFYLHVLAPNTQTWNLKLLTIDAGDFASVRNYIWIYAYKILTLSFLSIWYLTNKDWWRFFLFIPIMFEISRLFGFIHDRYKIFEEYHLIYSLPIFLVFSLALISISKRLKINHKNKHVKDKLNEEIYDLMQELSVFRNKNINKIRKDIELIRRNKHLLSKKEYLIKLIELRDKMSI